MVISSIRTLLIEDNSADARAISEALAEVPEAAFELDWADGLGKGLQKLASEPVDLVLLDLHLPESRGLATFATTHECAPGVPITVMTGLDDRELALKAVRDGAQDYLVKGQVDGPGLVRSMQHAVVRHRMQGKAEGPSRRDGLTGLHNRQGFLVLGEQLLRLADHTECSLALVYADIDGLEKINQAFGRQQGDAALRAVARALLETFRESDLVARVGGDEFACICSRCHGWPKRDFKTVFQKSLETCSPGGERPYTLTVTWGLSNYDPAKPCAMANLIKRAAAPARPEGIAPQG
jgi:two-component system, cell cycle response regulator